jgi:hypothetical protein
MVKRPLNPAGKQMLLVAILILALGFYQQYTEASGIFAPDGLAHKAGNLAERLIEFAAATAPSFAEPDGEESVPAIASSIEAALIEQPNSASPAGAVSASHFGHCSAAAPFGGHCH